MPVKKSAVVKPYNAYLCSIKKIFIISIVLAALQQMPQATQAQCAMCTKTAQQLGEKPAKGLNSAILYLMLTPFAIGGVIGYRWWKNNRMGG